MMKHTPGPWIAVKGDGWKIVQKDSANFSICRIDNAITHLMDFDEAAEGDAHLIAAAPDLLEALEAVRNWCAGHKPGALLPHEKINAAIAKARQQPGEQS